MTKTQFITEKLFDSFGCLIPRQGGQEIMTIDPEAIIQLLSEHGVVAFRGFKLDLEQVRKFTDVFGTKFFIHSIPQVRPSLSEDSQIAGVAIGSGSLALHGEMFYNPVELIPELLWFFCTVPPRVGGETTLADGFSFLEKLSPKTRGIFEKKEIMYIIKSPEPRWKRLFGSDDVNQAVRIYSALTGVTNIRVDHENTIIYHYITSAIAKTKYQNKPAFINSVENTGVQFKGFGAPYDQEVLFADGTPISKEIYDELRVAADSVTQKLVWQKFDLILVDNTRILHGRAAFEGDRQIAVRFSNTNPALYAKLKSA